MVRLFLVIALVICHCVHLQAQADSVLLENITIRALPWQEFAAGLKVASIKQEAGVQHSLASVLSTNPRAYVKAYGAGQLATLSIRGTSSSQNALFWHGVNVNITSLGQSDFSLTPFALIDRADLQLGASSSLLGSDAIGGSIHIANEQPKSTEINLFTGLGSFGHHQVRVAASAVAGKFSFTSKAFRQSAKNNFPYTNTTKRGHPRETMENASFAQYGFTQDTWWQPTANKLIGLHVWFTDMDRNIQPTLSGANHDHQHDQSKRIMLDYYLENKFGKTEFKLARLEDRINFNGSLSVMPRVYGAVDHEVGHGSFTHKIGANVQRFGAKIDAYGSQIAELRSDLYYSVSYEPANSWLLTWAIRQTLAEGFDPPVTPSIGWEHTIGSKWKWSGNLARSYRMPTLNDRYWQPGGNPDLLPEHGMHGETSMTYSASSHFSTSVTLYGGKVTNWIIWLPNGSYWSPENIDKVTLSGVEYDMEWRPIKALAVALSYSLTKSVREQSYNPRFVGKQLPYVPMHQAKSTLSYTRQKLKANIAATWTGLRYTTADNDYRLPAFLLVDMGLAWPLHVRWLIAASANNITNSTYQLMENRAMPGINFNLTIQHTFKFNK